MKIVQVVHTEERRRKKTNKQTNKQTNTNLRHTQCVNNEIHIGGRQDRHISNLLLTSRRSLITLAEALYLLSAGDLQFLTYYYYYYYYIGVTDR